MTLPEFLAKLAETPRDWQRDEWGLRSHGQCPITAVAAWARAGGWRLCEWPAAAARLGLDSHLARRIVAVADTDQADYGPADLRAALLVACGLPVTP